MICSTHNDFAQMNDDEKLLKFIKFKEKKIIETKLSHKFTTKAKGNPEKFSPEKQANQPPSSNDVEIVF